MLFDALLTVVFENIVFNPTKIILGPCLGPILLKKCFLERYLMLDVGLYFARITHLRFSKITATCACLIPRRGYSRLVAAKMLGLKLWPGTKTVVYCHSMPVHNSLEPDSLT
jgi:hypothetical protein